MVRILPFLAKGKEKITECGNYIALWSSSDIIYISKPRVRHVNAPCSKHACMLAGAVEFAYTFHLWPLLDKFVANNLLQRENPFLYKEQFTAHLTLPR
jgi:hypothetical protein